MNPLVELHGVSKSYGSAIALHATALSFERGKTTVLIGPSGCGKSTLLRLIIRLLDPDAGTIRFDEVPITQIFQNFAGGSVTSSRMAVCFRTSPRGKMFS